MRNQVDAWNALFNFHETFTTADAVPFSPRVLPVGEGATRTCMTMTGIMPIAWSEMLGKQRGRCPRPHLASAAVIADAGDDTGAESLRRPVTGEGVDESLPLPLVNSVTGKNHAPGARMAAKASVASQAAGNVQPELPEAEEDIIAGSLYFIELPEFEGDMRVGVGRPERDGDEEGSVV
eukprot:2862239-Pleurochrysis_carterae.AAC.1